MTIPCCILPFVSVYECLIDIFAVDSDASKANYIFFAVVTVYGSAIVKFSLWKCFLYVVIAFALIVSDDISSSCYCFYCKFIIVNFRASFYLNSFRLNLPFCIFTTLI